MDPELVTQGTDNVEVNAGGAADDGNAGAQDQPFLKISDRTVYKTADDAIKGYNEAQNRISSLTGYEKLFKKYGVDKPSPELAEQIVTEYIKLRDAAKSGKGSQEDKSKSTGTAEDDQLTPEQKNAIKWLQDNAEKAGYVSAKK